MHTYNIKKNTNIYIYVELSVEEKSQNQLAGNRKETLFNICNKI